jgi:hypothetical protein
MSSFFLALFRALTTPDGASAGDLLSVRRKSHLLQAEWYARLAKAGENKRRTAKPSQGKPASATKTLQQRILPARPTALYKP